jgi:hypothetical protein
MKTNSRNQRPKQEQDWQAKRGPYTWHLRPPFKDGGFDRSQWWKGKADIDPVAALYEIARRHPSVGRRDSSTPALIVLGNIGLNSWPKLSPGHQAMWKSFAGNLKGVDCRNDEEKCYDVVWQDEGEPLNQAIALQRGNALPTVTELEAGIARRAIAAYRQGYILLAVAPELESNEAKTLLARKYSEHRIMDGTGKHRARLEDWLALIAVFEKDATSKDGLKFDSFNRYKRAVDSIKFMSSSTVV